MQHPFESRVLGLLRESSSRISQQPASAPVRWVALPLPGANLEGDSTWPDVPGLALNSLNCRGLTDNRTALPSCTASDLVRFQ